METKYKIVSRIGKLPPEARANLDFAMKQHLPVETITTLLEELRCNRFLFEGIVRENSVLAFSIYRDVKVPVFKKGEQTKRTIGFIWGEKGEENQEFQRENGASPAVYLLEKAIREGVRLFEYGALKVSGHRFIGILKSRGLLRTNRTYSNTLTVQPKWVKRTKLRPKLK